MQFFPITKVWTADLTKNWRILTSCRICKVSMRASCRFLQVRKSRLMLQRLKWVPSVGLQPTSVNLLLVQVGIKIRSRITGQTKERRRCSGLKVAMQVVLEWHSITICHKKVRTKNKVKGSLLFRQATMSWTGPHRWVTLNKNSSFVKEQPVEGIVKMLSSSHSSQTYLKSHRCRIWATIRKCKAWITLPSDLLIILSCRYLLLQRIVSCLLELLQTEKTMPKIQKLQMIRLKSSISLQIELWVTPPREWTLG